MLKQSAAAADRNAQRGPPAMGSAPALTVVAEHIAAVNAFDTDAIVATFADDAYINDNRREISGIDAIRRFIAREIVGDRVTMDVREVIDHHGDTIVRARYDGTYDKRICPTSWSCRTTSASETARSSAC